MIRNREREDGQAGYAHLPVLLAEVLDLVRPGPGKRYLDGTVGLGGHTLGIMERSQGQAQVIGLDRDEAALAKARERLAPFAGAHLFQSRYSHFEAAMDELGWDLLDGALLDLGVSSLQLDSAERGFSFLADGPLDMRMGGADGAAPASRLVNTASFERLRELIGRLGEEPLCGRISRAICAAREEAPIETTARLAAIVEGAYPAKMRATARRHPATRTFQALRMAVNEELEELDSFLRHIVDRLAPGGRLAIISFHSLEDRLVKHSLRDAAKACVCPPRQPVCTCRRSPKLEVLTKRPIMASEAELAANPRSRSAKLRAAERLADSGEARR